MKYLILAFLLLFTNVQAMVFKPDQKMTPGSRCVKTDKDFLKVSYADKIDICKRNVNTADKIKVFNAYGVPQKERTLYTIDHKVSLFLGGSNHMDNLWPQPKTSSSAALENQTFIILNKGKIGYQKALDIILSVKK